MFKVPPSYTHIAVAYHAVDKTALVVQAALNKYIPGVNENKLEAPPDKLRVTVTV